MTLVLGFAAVNTGNNLLYLIVAALLAFMASTGFAGKRNIEGYQFELDAPDEVYAGSETLLTLRIHNPRRFLPALLLRVELDDASVLLPYLPAQSSGRVTLPYSPQRRGHNRIKELRISSPFPVAFFVRRHTFILDGDILAFPAPRPLPYLLRANGKEAHRPGPSSARRGHQGVVAGIFDYTGNEPLKRIHWRLSARHDSLKVKELESDASEPVIIVPAELPGATWEERLSGAAWLIDRTLRRGRPVGLRLGSVLLAPGSGRDHKLKLLRALALADAD
ncbi:MAG: DUF58 domain-containing protein [Desulfuromonadales bacterium]|nr:DUF58 domain-containing protein [Desulfuromonadales bacterium]